MRGKVLCGIAFSALMLAGLGGKGSWAQGSTLGPFQVSGWMEFYGSLNWEGKAANALRVFDGPTGFRFNGMELSLEKSPASWGLRVDLVVGPIGDAVQGANNIVQQFYATLPLRGGWSLDVGKFVTPHGAEVIETKDNWNASRGLLFGFAIPFYHTGLRMRGRVNETLALAGFLVNGWDRVDDNNRGKTLGLQSTWSLGPSLSLTANWMGGPEQPGVESRWRHLVDTLLSYQPSSRLAFLLNADYGTEEGMGQWSGLALYGRYGLGEGRSLALRIEGFNDSDGARGLGGHAGEATLTYEQRLGPEHLLRWEYRHDRGNQPFFNGQRSQNTLSATLVVLF